MFLSFVDRASQYIYEYVIQTNLVHYLSSVINFIDSVTLAYIRKDPLKMT